MGSVICFPRTPNGVLAYLAAFEKETFASNKKMTILVLILLLTSLLEWVCYLIDPRVTPAVFDVLLASLLLSRQVAEIVNIALAVSLALLAGGSGDTLFGSDSILAMASMLAAGQPEVDIRVDARIPGSSPDAPPVPVVIAMPQHDAHLIGFLDGVPPDQARRVSVDGLAGAEGWLFRQSLYLRVLGLVQYPAFLAKAGGTDGTQVYQFSGDVRSVVVLRDGRAMTLFVREP